MEANSKTVEETKSFWSKGFAARLYRNKAAKQYRGVHTFLASKVGTLTPSSLLDIACGGGDVLSVIHTQYPNIKLTGTDLAPGMLAEARNKLGPYIQLIEAPAEHQPFPGGSFNVVVTTMAFHHFPQKLEALKEVKRVLSPSGTYFIADIVSKTTFAKKIANFLEKLISVKGYVGHYTEEDIKHLSSQAGFASCLVEYIPGMGKRYKLCTLKV